MALKYRRSDFDALPDEERILATMREAGVDPGYYFFPDAEMSEMSDPDVVARFDRGPVGIVTVMPDGTPPIGKRLLQWFVFAIVVSIFVAYLTGRTMAPGAEYFAVFRVAGTTAFLAYGLGHLMDSIWGGIPWRVTAKNVFDGLIYGLLVAGSFAGFWPGS
ncbi:MAG: hypothetical protein R3199_05255 [Gemmatimonadota bacterium]|nr:hypothetical protein [Gemmatimonadota bacterium]